MRRNEWGSKVEGPEVEGGRARPVLQVSWFAQRKFPVQVQDIGNAGGSRHG